MSEIQDIIRTTADTGMLILIWLVQLIIYPAFHSIEAGLFPEWHRKYMTVIAVFVIPLMLVQAACVGLQLCSDRDIESLTAAGAILAAWLVTFAISAPCHQQLQKSGRDNAVIKRLIMTNWLRTACWSVTWLLGIWRLIA